MVKHTQGRGNEARAALIAHLQNIQNQRPETVDEMAVALGWSRNRVHHHLCALAEMGITQHSGGSRGWHLVRVEEVPE